MSAAKIAKTTGAKPELVRSSLKVAGSELASAATARYDLTLTQALAVAEFDGDPEAVKALVATAKKDPGRWDHVLGRLRHDRDYEAKVAARVAQLTETGVRVLDEGDLPARTIRLSHLADAEGRPLDPEAHATCPGHAVVLASWDLDQTIALCIEADTQGHTDRYGSSRQASQGTPDGKMTEEAKAERRAVIEGNKAWRAAREVRRQFLRELIARKSAPKSTLRYVARAITANPNRVGDGPEELMADLLGDTSETAGWGRHAGPAAAEQASDARLPLVLLAQVAADAETALHDHVWRSAPPATAVEWLAWLAEQGYHLSKIDAKVVNAGAEAEGR